MDYAQERDRLYRRSAEELGGEYKEIETMLAEIQKLGTQAIANTSEVGRIILSRRVDLCILSLMTLQRVKVEVEEEGRFDEIVRTAVPKEKHVAGTKEPRLYAITSIAPKRFGGTRTPVVCDSFDAACEYVENNSADLWENSYMLVVIEPNKPNYPYGMGLEREEMDGYWYRWNLQTNRYEPIEKPEEYKHTVCFGIG